MIGLRFPEKIKEIREHNKEVEEQEERMETRRKMIERYKSYKRNKNYNKSQSKETNSTKVFLTNTTLANKNSNIKNFTESVMKRGQRNNNAKLDKKIKDLTTEEESETVLEPMNSLDLVGNSEKEFIDLMRKLEEDDLQLIQAVQGLDEDIAYLTKGINDVNRTGEEKLNGIQVNIE